MSIISPPPNKNAIKIVIAFAAIYIIWGTTYLAIRIAVETLPPFLMAGVRFVLAGLVTFVFLRSRGVPLPTREQWRSAAIIGAFLLVGGNGFVTWSEQQVPSGMAALIIATDPLWITVFDWLIFKGAKPGKKTVFGLILGFLGIVLLIGPGQMQGTSGISLFSLAVLFMAPVLWSLGSLYSREAALPENAFMATAVEMLCGGSFLVIAGLLTGETARLDWAGISLRSLTAMAYLTIFGSIVAFTAYVWLLKMVQASKVATYTYVNPVIAVFLGWLILSETVTAQTLIAVPSIILAVGLITTQTTKKEDGQLEEEETAVSQGTAVAD
ncbi:MAG: drug/metabolite exporter YedA [Ardenticatenaceae bacterium]|nr:drug/metabolite exporter YedA [Ardenticatenaceae bacterium]MCB9443823.1 drug/metabolite exporter YedA [Ardenticatenaceae bacterium]